MKNKMGMGLTTMGNGSSISPQHVITSGAEQWLDGSERFIGNC